MTESEYKVIIAVILICIGIVIMEIIKNDNIKKGR